MQWFSFQARNPPNPSRSSTFRFYVSYNFTRSSPRVDDFFSSSALDRFVESSDSKGQRGICVTFFSLMRRNAAHLWPLIKSVPIEFATVRPPHGGGNLKEGKSCPTLKRETRQISNRYPGRRCCARNRYSLAFLIYAHAYARSLLRLSIDKCSNAVTFPCLRAVRITSVLSFAAKPTRGSFEPRYVSPGQSATQHY